MEKTVHLNIGGMTCVNCQNKIEKGLLALDGVNSASVSYNRGTADIAFDGEKLSLDQIISTVEDLDYEVLLPEQAGSPDFLNTVSILVIIVAFYVMLQSLGILNRLVPSQLADTGMGFGMLFVIGLVTSVHCIAMCGGINLSQCIPQNSGHGSLEGGSFPVFLPSLLYNLGRVCSYTAVGFVLGFAGFLIGGGEQVGLSAFLQGILKMLAGLFMVIMGVNMLGLFPWLRRFTIRMPRFLAKKIGTEKARAGRPFIVGLLNGFMPCGPLQSMWIVALATGNPFTGALSMFAFSAGTVPLMLGLGSVVSVLGKKFSDAVMTAGAVLVVVLGLAMLSQGGLLSGWLPPELLLVLVIACCIAGVVLSLPVRKKGWKTVSYIVSLVIVTGACALWNLQGTAAQSAVAGETAAELVDGVQVIQSTLEPGRYPDITVQAGIPVRWVINAPESSINGCNYRMLIRDYDVTHTFQPGENIIEFTPLESKAVSYSCWMGMIHGTISVTDTPGEQALPEDVPEGGQLRVIPGGSCCG